MASYADARHHGGAWLVRIEDVDLPRARPHAADAILAALEAYGFEWNEDVWRQSTRTRVYETALAKLADDGVVYACACTRRELADERVSAIGERVYAGTCRNGIGDCGVSIFYIHTDHLNVPRVITRRSTADGKADDPKFDHRKYDAIGESDRMTLRFRKPA